MPGSGSRPLGGRREIAPEIARALRPDDNGRVMSRTIWSRRAWTWRSAVTELLAEGVGFEPTMGYEPIAVFKTAALGHYASPPVSAEV